MANVSRSEKSVDLPPKGSRNADPITDAPGSHPIENRHCPPQWQVPRAAWRLARLPVR